MNRRKRRLFFLRSLRFLLFNSCLLLVHLEAAPNLPIYLEDCHAGSFYWLARNLDLDQPYLLLHFDAHSDANAIFGSDNLRDALRQVPSVEERTRRLENWRKIGAVQCFDWIEPLMPRPLERVIWVPAEILSPGDQAAREKDARDFLDGHEEVAPRACGNLAEHYEVCSFESLRARSPSDLPIVASVDLDYFAALPDGQLDAAFERVFSWLLTLPRLQAITFAVSTPYLKDQAQAQRLTGLAMQAAVSVNNADIHFEPFARPGPDYSRAMRILAAAGQPLPVFDVAAASPGLRSFYVRSRERLQVGVEQDRWRDLLNGWAADLRPWSFGVSAAAGQMPDPDGCWRLPEQSAFSVGFPAGSASGSGKVRVRWLASEPALTVYNVVEPVEEGSFAAGAPRFIRSADRLVREDTTLDKPLTSAELRPFFDPANGLGNLRLHAEVLTEDGNRIVTNTLWLCRVRGTGLQGALCSQFNRPYVYGSGLLRGAHGATGPDAEMGADCTNFLIAGLRNEGWRLPWGNPGQFRRYLEPVPDKAALTNDDIARGVFIDFGTHMAAVWEDREPRGVLDGNDLVVHQLEGRPEILPLRELLSRRSNPSFQIERLRAEPVACRLLFGGDVMLAHLKGDPFGSLAGLLKGADLCVVNLECAITDQGVAKPGKPFAFRAEPQSAGRLRAAGVGAVSVANNHSGDFGQAGFLDMLTRLDQAGVRWFGGGRDSSSAYRARTLQAGPLRVALVGYSDADTELLPARDPGGGVAVSDDWPAILGEVRRARKDGADFIAVMPHWGVEGSSEVADRQREQATDLIGAGADLVVGSGPHRVQAQEDVEGQPVTYSLGNLIFDSGGGEPDWWRSGELLEVTLGSRGRILRTRDIPVGEAK
jgi:poly-gamma-glutamate capsule biosynthesis protein CapA/YwtB (metallophosphatase superfamily)